VGKANDVTNRITPYRFYNSNIKRNGVLILAKKLVFWIVFLVAAGLLAAVAMWGKQYYEARYVGEDYYVMVPLDYDMESKPIYSMAGNELGRGIVYNLTANNEQGDSQTISFTVFNSNSSGSRGEIQPQPGTYLWISARKQIVLRWKAVDENDIPEKALKMIKEGYQLVTVSELMYYSDKTLEAGVVYYNGK